MNNNTKKEIIKELTKDELKNEIERYLKEFKIIYDSFEIYKCIKIKVVEYEKEINSVSRFLITVLHSLQYTYLIGLSKMLLQDEEKNIKNLLTLCGYNLKCFPSEHVREYKNEDEKIVYSDKVKIDINSDIKNIKMGLKINKNVIDKLDNIRNKFLAHSDSDYYNNVSKLFEDNKITYEQIEKVLIFIENTLLYDLIDTTWCFNKSGVEEFSYICESIKEYKKLKKII